MNDVRDPCHVEWCDGTHPVLYRAAGEPGARDHFREIGRLNDAGDSQVVVGVALSADPGAAVAGPAVLLLHLGSGGCGDELQAGEIYLSPAGALALGPLLAEAAEVVGRAMATAACTCPPWCVLPGDHPGHLSDTIAEWDRPWRDGGEYVDVDLRQEGGAAAEVVICTIRWDESGRTVQRDAVTLTAWQAAVAGEFLAGRSDPLAGALQAAARLAEDSKGAA